MFILSSFLSPKSHFFFAVLLCFAPQLAVAGPCLTFIAQDNRIVKEISLNVSDALNNAGICHTIEHFPEKRADFLFKNEKYDGFIMRDAMFENRSPTPVIKIDPLLVKTSGVILSKDSDVKSIEDLKGRSIGIVRGWLWMEFLTKRYPRVVKASNIKDLGHLFHEGRVDTILVVEEILPYLKLAGYSCTKIIDLEGHIFLKETSQHSVLDVSNAIKDHLKNGQSFINIPRILSSFANDV